MSRSNDSEFEDDLPEEIIQAAREAVDDCLPRKSRLTYEQIYTNFITWKTVKRIKNTSETVLLAYFALLSKTLAPSTLWARWSMLKTMLQKNEGININKYPKLKRFLKEKSTGFTSKKAKTFTDDNIKQFLIEAPDVENLDAKAALILGITGAMRREEMKNICLKDIRVEQSHLTVTIPKTKTKIVRTFTINSPFKEVVEEYIRSRPNNQNREELFLHYRDGKCTNQVMGINKIGKMPERIASWLGLEDPQQYTGHSFRRTSATLLANAGASMTTMKRHGGWNSTKTAEGYIADSINNKRKICDQIMGNIVDEDQSDDPGTNRVFKRIKLLTNSNNQPSTSAQTTSKANVATANTCIPKQVSTSSRPAPSTPPAKSKPSITIELNDCSIM